MSYNNDNDYNRRDRYGGADDDNEQRSYNQRSERSGHDEPRRHGDGGYGDDERPSHGREDFGNRRGDREREGESSGERRQDDSGYGAERPSQRHGRDGDGEGAGYGSGSAYGRGEREGYGRDDGRGGERDERGSYGGRAHGLNERGYGDDGDRDRGVDRDRDRDINLNRGGYEAPHDRDRDRAGDRSSHATDPREYGGGGSGPDNYYDRRQRYDDDDLRGAKQHARSYGGSDRDDDDALYDNAVGYLSSNRSRIGSGSADLDEREAVRAHRAMYGGGSGGDYGSGSGGYGSGSGGGYGHGGQGGQGQYSAEMMGAGAAMQALKVYSGGQGQGQGQGQRQGQSQGQFVGLAMAQAGKLFDQQSAQGNVVRLLLLSLSSVLSRLPFPS